MTIQNQGGRKRIVGGKRLPHTGTPAYSARSDCRKSRFHKQVISLEFTCQCPRCHREKFSPHAIPKQIEMWHHNEPCVISSATCKCGEDFLIRLDPKIEIPLMLLLSEKGIGADVCLAVKRILFSSQKNPEMEIWNVGMEYDCQCPDDAKECVCTPGLRLENILIDRNLGKIFEERIRYCQKPSNLFTEEDAEKIIGFFSHQVEARRG